MGRDIFKKWLSGITIASLLVNSLLPYGLVGITYAQESIDSEGQETIISSEAPSISPTPSPTTTPDPITATPSATPTPTSSPSPSPLIDPSPTSTPSATPEASPTPSPPASPTTGATPTPSTDLTVDSQEKTSPRKEGDFLKEKINKEKGYVEGEVIVKFKKEKIDVNRTLGRVQAYVFEKQHSLNKKDEIKNLNIRVFKSKKSTEELIKELESDPNVKYAQPNYIYEPTAIGTNDTYKDLLWGLDNTGQTVEGTYYIHTGTPDKDIDAPEAWELNEGSGDVIVAVIDSGVAYNHPDLLVNMWDGTNCKDENGNSLGGCISGYDYEYDDKDPAPSSSSHGTHIAGTIAAAKDNGIGIIGVAPNIKIMAIKTSLTSAENVKGIYFAKQNGAKVINASWGCYGSDQGGYSAVCGTPDYDDFAMIDAINNFQGLFITTAGNGDGDTDSDGDNHDSGQTLHSYPCDHTSDNIICVAATDQNDNLASFSDYGVTSVDVGAPGVNIYSTVPDLTSSIVFSEDFNTASNPTGSKFVGGGVNNDWGILGMADKWITSSYSSFKSYLSNSDSTLTTVSAIDTSSSTDLALIFYVSCDTPINYTSWTDYIQVEFLDKNDQWIGNQDWRYDTATSPFNYWNLSYIAPVNNSFFHKDFKFRFRWITDATDNNYYGCDIDDVNLINVSSGSAEKYDYKNGTSMAVPHVAGLAGLIWSYQPELSYSQVKDTILKTGDPLDDLAEKTFTGRRINAHKALLSLEASTITGLLDDPIPIKSKTWSWNSDDATAEFRYLIDKVENSVPSDVYGDVKTATQKDGDGVYYIHVQAKSTAGVEGPVTTVFAVLDNSAPVVEILAPLNGSIVNGSSTIEFSNNEIVNTQCSFDGLSSWTSCTNGLTTLADIAGFGMLPEGTFNLYIKGTDVAGNTGNDTETGIIKDTTAPTGLIINPIGGSILATIPAFTVSADDENGIVSVKFQYKASVSGDYTEISTDIDAPYEADWAGITLTSNTIYDLRAIIEDIAGNLETISGVFFTYDITAPDQPIITNPTSPVTINSDNYSIKGTTETGSLVKIYTDSSVVGSQQLPELETTFDILVSLTQDSINSFEVSSTDAVGNESSKVIVSEITEDSIFPTIDDYILDNPVISPQVSPGIKDFSTIDLLFSEKVNYSIKIKDDGGTVVESWFGTATNPYSKTWDGKDTLENYVADGIYTIEVVFTDKADNSTTDTSKTITINNNPLTLNPIENKNVDEETELIFTAEAFNDEASIIFALSGAPAGALIDSLTGAFSWTPTEVQGPWIYNFSINATSGDLSKSEEISVTVNEVNSNPQAFNDSILIKEDNSETIILSATDSDLPPNNLTYSIVDNPAHGSVSLSGNEATYTPETNFNGIDSFTYKANDGTANSNIATILITIDPVNDAPVAGDDTASVDEDKTFTISKDDLLANDLDVDEGDLISFVDVINPINGTVVTSEFNVEFTPDANFNGPASFEYTISDGTLEDTATVSITVNPVNDAPVANDGSATTNEDTPVTISLSGSDVDGDSLIYSIASNPSHGSVSLLENKATYTPNENYTGFDSFIFEVSDTNSSSLTGFSSLQNIISNFLETFGPNSFMLTSVSTDTANGDTVDSNTATISITIDPVNDAPVISTSAQTTATEDELYTYNADVSDIDGPGAVWGKTDLDTCGGTIDSVTGIYTFTPTGPIPPASCVLSISVNDGGTPDLSATQTATISIIAVNDEPVAVDDSYTTNEDTILNIVEPGVLANDSDVDDLSLSTVLVTDVSHGTLTLNSNGSFTYNPELNYNGADSFTYKANDGTANSNIATVFITVISVNDAPEAGDDTVSVNEDMTLSISKSKLLANDSDVDEDTLYFIDVSNPINGSVSEVGDDIKFIPDADFNGEASFEYTISDGSLTNTGLVTITVDPVNDLPVAVPQTISVEEDTPTIITLLGTDVDGDSLTYSIVTDPSHGSLEDIYDNNKVSYTPNSDYVGPDSFEFKVSDEVGDSLTVTVSINVTPSNDPPVLGPIGDFSINELELLTFTASASNPEDETLLFSLDGAPDGATINSFTGVFSWTPTEIQGPGEYTFSVIVSDGVKTDSEEIKVDVNEVNLTPVAVGDDVSTDEDTEILITLNAADADYPENELIYLLAEGPSNGILSSISGNQVTYIPNSNYNGPDSFSFKVNDGTINSEPVFINIVINPVNDSPISTNDTFSTDEDTPLDLFEVDLISNDTDVDEGDTLFVLDVFNPIGGTVEISGSDIIFTPNLNFNGAASFDYTVSDGTLTDTATVTVNVNPVNDTPVAEDGFASTEEDAPITITLVGSDVDGDDLEYSIVSEPPYGTVSLSANEATYTPIADYNGTDSFTFTVNDGTVDSNIATISITVNPVNDSPEAINDSDTTPEDTPLSIDTATLLSNDIDVDNNPLSIISVGNLINGAAQLLGSSIVFVPTANFNGVASFDYIVSDGALTDTATVSITVNPVNDAPVANDGSVLTGEDTSVTITLSADDIDSDPLTYLIETGVSNGVLGDISGNKVSYTPNASFTGSDSFTFKANDGMVDSNIATVSITVNPLPAISNEAINTPGETSITITWTTDNPSTSRVIYDTVSHAILDVAPNYGYSSSTLETDTSSKVTSHSVTISGLTAGTTYYYRVVSHGSPEVVGDEKSFTTESEKSSDGEVAAAVSAPVCTDAKPKSAPILLSAVATGLNEVTLTWSGAESPVSYYLIAYGTSSGTFQYGNPNVGGADTTSYIVRNLSGQQIYYFKIRAGNGCMPGDFSNELTVSVSGIIIEEPAEGFAQGILGVEEEEEVKGVEEEILGEEIEIPEESGESVLGRSKVIRVILWGGAVLGGLILIYFFFSKRRKKR